ncbi:MAG: YidC/Oxa1 family insertase periplasmic-domain containing protein [Opitutales bacterium]|jgi:YidC/Oxa1 family membrane protein insertase
MDKKSVSIGLVFVIGGFFLMMYNSTQQEKSRQEELLRQAQENEQALQESGWTEGSDIASPAEIVPAATQPPAIQERVVAAVPPVDQPLEQLAVLNNEHLRIQLSSYGAAVTELVLKQQPADNPHIQKTHRPVILNRVSDSPALDLKRSSGDDLATIARFYTLVSASDREATFEAVLPSGLVIRRHYKLSNGEDPEGPLPYLVEHQTIFSNSTGQPLSLDKVYLDLGTAAPTEADYRGFNLNASYLANGDFETIPVTKFSGGGFFVKKQPREMIEEKGILQWGAVKNQFFTTIFTPETPADGIRARGIRFPQDPKTGKVPVGINASLEFALPTLQPGEQFVLAGGYYAGPKSFERLSQLDQNQEDVLQLSWFLSFYPALVGFVAKVLLSIMSGLEGFVGNWGVAIILTTFVIRLCLWPLTAKAARSSKRMQELQKPLQAIREKYQDNPQKLNEEMMKLWKKHKINPLSGCWPVLIQFPIFIAFFNLLRNSSDLRFANFLWINDLSMPDASIPLPGEGLPFLGAAINILPFVWLVSMYFQMRMMPQPSIDNAQTKMIKWMPFIFFPFTYYFSSGLVLYWTTTNCFSIFQQWMTNRSKDEEDIAIEEEVAEMENPKRGKLSTGPLISRKKKKKNKGESR